MNKLKISLPENLTSQARVALSITTILLSALVVFDIYSTYNYLKLNTQTQLIAMLLSYGMTIVAVMGARMSWQNRVARAGWVLIAGSVASLLFSNFLGAGLGIIYALTSLVVVTAIASTMLPSDQTGWAILLSVISGVAGILIDNYLPSPVAGEGLPQTFTYAMLAALILGQGFIIARQLRKYSLRTKLLISGITLTIISIGTLGLTNYYFSRSNLTKNTGLSLKSLAESQAQAIGNVLLQEAHLLKSFALSKLVQDGVDLANAAYGPDQVFNQEQIDQLDATWRAADAANSDFHPLVSSRLNNDIASELREFRSGFPENAEIFVTDQYGALVASTNRTSDYYQADEDWWQAAFNEGKGNIYFGQPEYDESSKTFGLILAVPLYSHGTDEVTGVMRTTININAVLEILSADILGGSGQADLYLPDNQVLDPEYPTGLVSADPEALSRLQTLIESNSAETMVYEGLPGILSAASVTSSKAEGEGAIRNLGWTVVVHQDQAASLAPIQAQTRSTILIAVAILALGAAAAMYVAQTLSGPITRLTAIAEKIGAGDNSAQAIVETEDEIGTLAQTFNSMTSQLREFIATLEQRVADRTMELEAAQKQMVRRASELATVAEVGTVSSSVLEVKQLLQTVVELSKERFNLYHAHVYLMDEAGENLVLTAGAGEPGRIMSEEKRSIPLSREQSLVARAARERKGVIVNDVTQAPDFLPNPLLPETRSELAVPLIVGGKVLGVFDVQSNQVGRFSEVDVDIQSTLASQTAVALQNARQFAARQQAEEAVARRAAELATVARVSSAAATVLESEQLLHEVVELTKQEFKLYHSHVYLLNEAGDTLVLAAGSGEPGRRMAAEKRSIPLNQERSLVARAAREKQGVIANDVRSESDFLPNPFLPETRSELAVPLLVGDRVLGVFDVQSDQVNRFTNEDVNIQSTLASQIAIAMQNARAFTQAQRQAEREATLNLIGQKIQSTVTVEAALQVAARELGRALGAPLTIAQLGLKSDQGNSN